MYMYICRLLSRRSLRSAQLCGSYNQPCWRTRAFATTSRLSDSTYESDLFNYTSGRWVYNDTLRHNERRRVFNVSGLKRLAAESVQRKEDDVVHLQKLAEGGSNRTFLVKMRDGFQLVARIPYLVTEPKGLVVASEAATMNFLRSHGIPIPQIYGYSASTDNAAGTEHIFMEYITGQKLGDVWHEMSEENMQKLVASLVELESQIFDMPLPASGSLFHVEDIPDGFKKVLVQPTKPEQEHTFCIGPDMNLPLWFGRRTGLNVDRGPFTTSETVLAAGAKKEIAYLQNFGRPVLPFHRIRRETIDCKKQPPSPYIETLKKYLEVAPHLIPKNSSRLLLPTIRHPDLNPNNIFVSEDFEVMSLIDWQNCSILPLFLQCGIPASLENFDDPSSQSLDLPTCSLPEDFEDMSDEQQQEEYQLYRRRQLHYLYVKETSQKNKLHFEALTAEFSAARRKIYEQSGNPWEGDNVTLRSGLINMAQNWTQVVGDSTPCPISFYPEETLECLRLEAAQRGADLQMKESKDMLGIGPQGWVPIENYERVKAATIEMKADMIARAESEKDRVVIRDHWVYDEMSEEDYL